MDIRNPKVSKHDFTDPKPRQNGKQRRHRVGTREKENSETVDEE